MKLIADDVYLSYLPNGKVAVSFIATNAKYAELFIGDLRGKRLEVKATEIKSKRSLEQNDMLWAIIENISLKLNGNREEHNLWETYGEILRRANVKRELVAVKEEAIKILEKQFRAVVDTGQILTTNGIELKKVWVYLGSSKFNTKEMTELIEVALNYAQQIGASA